MLIGRPEKGASIVSAPRTMSMRLRDIEDSIPCVTRVPEALLSGRNDNHELAPDLVLLLCKMSSNLSCSPLYE